MRKIIKDKLDMTAIEKAKSIVNLHSTYEVIFGLTTNGHCEDMVKDYLISHSMWHNITDEEFKNLCSYVRESILSYKTNLRSRLDSLCEGLEDTTK